MRSVRQIRDITITNELLLAILVDKGAIPEGCRFLHGFYDSDSMGFRIRLEGSSFSLKHEGEVVERVPALHEGLLSDEEKWSLKDAKRQVCPRDEY